MYYVFVFLHTVWTQETPIFRRELWKQLMHLHINIFHIIKGYLLIFFTNPLILKEEKKKKKEERKALLRCAITIVLLLSLEMDKKQ